jgi:methionyl aminopeptidase
MLSDEALRSYREAGRIASKIRRLVPKIVREGVDVIFICEKIEAAVVELGGKPAFPCNVGINEIAAHYTSPLGDLTLVPENSIVKIDFGVQIYGYIADTAVTISLNREYDPLVYAAEEALNRAIEAVKPEVCVSELGAIIRGVIERRGYKPIRNLTGHKMDRYVIHTGKPIPNVPEIDGSKLKVGEVYAIEPFTTLPTAKGEVENLNGAFIYRFYKEKGVKTRESRNLLSFIKENYYTLPFAFRWLKKTYQSAKLDEAFNELLSLKCVIPYPVLVEATRKPVAQAEHTIIVEEDGAEVLTS